jgi:uncharacterized membrane protein YGL010W
MLNKAAANQGVFFWKRRYATHRSYHMNKANQIAHFIGTPLQLFAFIKFFTLGYFSGTILGTGCNLGLLLVTFLAVIYCRIHLFIGIATTFYLIGCWYVASYVLWTPIWYENLLIATGFFIAGVIIQVGIGHKIIQKQDTNLSAEFAEFFQTRDPMIFVLIFFFPFLDLFLSKKVNARSQS